MIAGDEHVRYQNAAYLRFRRIESLQQMPGAIGRRVGDRRRQGRRPPGSTSQQKASPLSADRRRREIRHRLECLLLISCISPLLGRSMGACRMVIGGMPGDDSSHSPGHLMHGYQIELRPSHPRDEASRPAHRSSARRQYRRAISAMAHRSRADRHRATQRASSRRGAAGEMAQGRRQPYNSAMSARRLLHRMPKIEHVSHAALELTTNHQPVANSHAARR